MLCVYQKETIQNRYCQKQCVVNHSKLSVNLNQPIHKNRSRSFIDFTVSRNENVVMKCNLCKKTHHVFLEIMMNTPLVLSSNGKHLFRIQKNDVELQQTPFWPKKTKHKFIGMFIRRTFDIHLSNLFFEISCCVVQCNHLCLLFFSKAFPMM